jgi:hypothetical protein
VNLKSRIKKSIGFENLNRFRQVKSQLKYLRNLKNHGKIQLNSNIWSLKQTIAPSGKHVFFGYYDLKQINNEGSEYSIGF